jgi:outer membrane lipoprotein-sorting protein
VIRPSSSLAALVLSLWTALLTATIVNAEEVAGKKAAPPARPASWYAATVAEDERGGFLMVHFWSKGPLFRSEAVLAGRRIVTIVDREKYYIIDAVGHTGVALERSEAAIALDDTRRRPFANDLDRLLKEGGELVGSEEAGGRSVDIYRVTNQRGRRTIWVSTTNPPIPLRVETYDRASGTTGKVDYVNWLHNPAISDDFFKPDPRVRLDHFSYESYRKRLRLGPVGPAPVLYRHLLHGESS